MPAVHFGFFSSARAHARIPRGDDSADIEHGRQQMVHDGVLVIRFVLRVRIHQHADPGSRRNIQAGPGEHFRSFHLFFLRSRIGNPV